ncbi:MAG: hypothetical protein ABGY96_01620 [bacterium]
MNERSRSFFPWDDIVRDFISYDFQAAQKRDNCGGIFIGHP